VLIAPVFGCSIRITWDLTPVTDADGNGHNYIHSNSDADSNFNSYCHAYDFTDTHTYAYNTKAYTDSAVSSYPSTAFYVASDRPA
jgi:hypothetical protein